MRTVRWITAAILASVALGAAAETLTSHAQKSFAPKPGGTFKVEASFQDVTVTVENRPTVDVTVDLKVTTWPADAKDYLEALKPVFDDSGNTILVRSRAKGVFTFGFANTEGRIDVKMPPGMALVLDTGSGDITVNGDTGPVDVACDTGSGDVKVEGTAKAFKADTGSGSVHARLTGPVGKVDVDTGSGDVDVRLTGPAQWAAFDTGSGGVRFEGEAAEFRADTGSGDVEAKGLAGAARFDTGSGGVRAEWTRLPPGSEVKVDTGSGEAHLAVPGSAVLAGVLDTGSGDIKSDFPGVLSRHDSRMTLAGGAGAATLRVSTSSGDITVAKKP